LCFDLKELFNCRFLVLSFVSSSTNKFWKENKTADPMQEGRIVYSYRYPSPIRGNLAIIFIVKHAMMIIMILLVVVVISLHY